MNELHDYIKRELARLAIALPPKMASESRFTSRIMETVWHDTEDEEPSGSGVEVYVHLKYVEESRKGTFTLFNIVSDKEQFNSMLSDIGQWIVKNS